MIFLIYSPGTTFALKWGQIEGDSWKERDRESLSIVKRKPEVEYSEEKEGEREGWKSYMKRNRWVVERKEKSKIGG